MANKKDFSALGLCEVMMRLSPSGKERISKTDIFLKHVGGSELNVVSGISDLGLCTGVITKLPNNLVGQFVRNQVRRSGVNDDYVLNDSTPDARLGTYYYEGGVYPRKPHVLYDRKHSAFTTLAPDDIPSDIFGKTQLFHTSGITLALGEKPQQTAITLMKRFKEAGALVSFDVNYRSNLWEEAEARECVESILPYVDILFVSEETSKRMLARTGNLDEIMKGFALEYNIGVVASTQRKVISHSIHSFNSTLYHKESDSFHIGKAYENIEVLDRIGSGDAYVAGVLYALLAGKVPAEAVEYGNAMSALKNTIDGDLVSTTLAEIDSIIKTHNSIGIVSEMDR